MSFTLKQDNRTTCVLDYTQPGTALTNENTGTPVVHTLTTDRLGQLIERTTTRKDAAGATITDQQVHITYTPDGARSHLVVNGQATDYTYDEGTGLLTTLMRTRSADNAVGEKSQSQSVPSVLESLTYHYDTDAHLTHITNHTGAVLRAFNTVPTIVEAGTTGGAQEADASYVTDGGWATIEHRHVDGQQQSVTTYYNAEGLVIGVDDTVDGLRLLTYDDAHQLTAVMTDHGTHRFTYDTAGFLIGEETTTGVTREYTYDAAGQLVRLQDSHTGVSEYVYDGLGRRVQHTDHTGAVSTYAYSPVGLLAEITGEDRDAVYLWNDALGQVAAVATSTADTGSTGADSADDSHSTMMCTLTWDPVAFTPTVLGVNNTLVSLGALASVDAVGGRGKDPFGLSPVVAGFTTGSGVGSDVSSDTQGLFATASIPGVPGLGLTRAGSVQVAGLEILGARVYDATTRGFMTPDPLVSPVGAGWGANVYAFAGNDPVGQVDPWGLSPMTVTQFREYRQDTSKRAGERLYQRAEQFLNDHAGLIAAATIVAGIAIMATGPVGWLGMAAVGGLLSFGGSVATQKLFGGKVNLKKSLIDGAVGFVGGGLGKLASMGTSALASSRLASTFTNSTAITKIGSALSSTRSGVTGAFGVARSWVAPAASRVASFASPLTSRISSAAAPMVSKAQPAVQVAGQWGRNIAGQYTSAGVVNEAAEGAVSGAVNNAGGYWFNAENGYKPTVSGALRSAGTGFGIGFVAPGISGGTSATAGAQGIKKVAIDRVSDFATGGTNYLISPSNDNQNKTPIKFVEEGFKNSLAGGSTSSGKYLNTRTNQIIDDAVPDHLDGLSLSRRDLLTGNIPGAPHGQENQ